jgi:hypothetical protein
VGSDTDAFVVREKDRVFKLLKLAPATQFVSPEDTVTLGPDRKPSFPIERDPQKDYVVAMCLAFDAVFSPSRITSKETDMAFSGHSPDGTHWDHGGDWASRTIVIRRKSSTAFTDDYD